MSKSKPKKSISARRKQTRAATAARAVKRVEAKIAAEKLAKEGPPGLEDRIVWLAADTVEAEDIIVTLGLRERLANDAAFRVKFDSLVERGQTQWRIILARQMREDALLGKVTAQRKMADVWLQRHMDTVADVEFATGFRERLMELIAKVGAPEHAHVRENLERLRKKKSGGSGGSGSPGSPPPPP